MKLTYMPHVDGLRAYAVLGVMCFHFGITALPGGFFGVDVFFVISGFLITSILWREMTVENFSYLTFYRRRALRILPALFAVTALTASIAYFLVSPKYFSTVANGLFGVATFSSNWVFQFDAASDYFAPSSDLNPFLHMWSLAIEEQFYIFFPAILMLIIKRAKSKTKMILTVIMVSSASLVVLLNTTNLFYITPARMWQLLAGSLLAMSFAKLGKDSRFAVVMSFFGIALIAVSYAAPFFEVTGLSAISIAPVVGAVLILGWGAHQNVVVRLILTSRPIVFVGKISYSLYLVHWPIVVFVRHLGLDPFTSQFQILSFVATFVLGYTSWKFVEVPFRSIPKTFSSTRVIQISAIGLALIGLLGIFFTVSGNSRIQDAQSSNNAHEKLLSMGDKLLYYPLYQRGSCFLDFEQSATDYSQESCLPWVSDLTSEKQRVLIFGDSHAAHLYPGLTANLSNSYDVGQLSAASCRPIASRDSRCNSTLEQLDLILNSSNTPDVLVIAGNWNSSLKQMTLEELVSKLDSTIRTAMDSEIHIVLVGQVPSFSVAVPDLLYRDNPSGIASYLNVSSADINPALKALALKNKVTFFDPGAAHCRNQMCEVGSVQEPRYWDAGHFTKTGSLINSLGLAALIEKMTGQ